MTDIGWDAAACGTVCAVPLALIWLGDKVRGCRDRARRNRMRRLDRRSLAGRDRAKAAMQR